MGRKSKEAAKRRAEALRTSIRHKSAAFVSVGFFLVAIARAAPDSAPIFITLAAGTLIACFWLRRGWMREYREALAASGVDPERDELVESGDSMAKTMMILFGLFGGFFVFLAAFMWLARR